MAVGQVFSRAANIGLRGLALGSRFLLIIALAKLFPPSAVGIFGLVSTMIVFGLLVVGAEFYSYSLRELLSRDKAEWSYVLQHHLLALLFLYAFLLPAQLLIFALDLLPLDLMGWFFLLLVLEHLGQELNRLLVAMQKPITASVVLFFRMGAWVWVVLYYLWADSTLRTLEFVLMGWSVGCLIGVIIGLFLVWRNVENWKWWPVDRQWIIAGFRVGILFLVSSLSMRAILTFDRFAVDYYVGADFLGVYVLYIGMAMTVVNILDPAVFAFLYPRLVEAYRKGRMGVYQKTMKELIVSTLVLSVFFALLIYFLSPYVYEWIDKPIYANYQFVLPLLLCASVIYVIGMVPHFGLYAKGLDKELLFCHVSSAIIFAILVIMFSQVATESAVPLALICAFFWMGALKLLFYKGVISVFTNQKPVVDSSVN